MSALSSTAYGVLPDQAARQARSRRVLVLLATLMLLGLGDLYATITHATSLGMKEMNPIGAYLIGAQSITGLVLFKLGTMGITVGLLAKVRHTTTAECTTWALTAVMVGLTFHWHKYNHELTQALVTADYGTIAAQLKTGLARVE